MEVKLIHSDAIAAREVAKGSKSSDVHVTNFHFNSGAFGRYAKQMRLAELGEPAQHALGASHAVIVGVGALGCSVADLLARAGVGHITLVDRDVVEWSNLQRQALYTEQDAKEGLPKAEAARRRLSAVNSSIRLEAVIADVSAKNAERVLVPDVRTRAERFLLVDGSDNFELRFLLNDVAVKHAVALAYAGVVGMEGTSMTIVPGFTPCLRCIGEKPPPGYVRTCDTAGVFGPAVAAIAAFEAAEVLRTLVHGKESVRRALISIDVWKQHVKAVDTTPMGPQPDCVCCAQRRFEHLEASSSEDVAVLCGQDAVHMSMGSDRRVNLRELADRWNGLGDTTCNTLLARLRFSNEERASEITVFADGRAIVRGTTKPEVARTMYARYVGA